MVDGFLVINKASGPTSHDVVDRVRKATGIQRIGHAGTLDPMATGALVVALGRATRLLRYVQNGEKEYVARVQFGVATDTLDAQGAVLWREPTNISNKDLESVLSRFRGQIQQVPPMVSAVRVGGRRLHEIARRGETVERLPRPVRIDVVEVTEFAPSAYPEAVIRVVCGPGTYIRVLADDIAGALGTRAHLSALHRLRVGLLSVEKYGIEDLDGWQAALIDPAEALSALPSVKVSPVIAEGVRHGVRFAAGPLADSERDEPEVVLDEAGHVLAVYRKGKAEVVLG